MKLTKVLIVALILVSGACKNIQNMDCFSLQKPIFQTVCSPLLTAATNLVPFPEEIKGIANAIEQCGRPMVFSLSPGGDVDPNHIEAFKRAHMLRVTKDIWDEQTGIDEAFEAWRKWQGKEEPGFWIDMDMIPFGQLQLMSPKPEGLEGNESREEI